MSSHLPPGPARPSPAGTRGAGPASHILAGALGMTFVGGSVAVSGVLPTSALATAQALRYGLACLLLVGYARGKGLAVRRPRGAEWLWLLGVSGSGLVLFNVALVHGSRHAEPAVLGVAVACVPVVFAVAGPLLERRGPRPRVLGAAALVTAGAALVQGIGRADGWGLLWAFAVFAGEAGFTLLAVPVLGRHGPLGVSVHATWIAAAVFAVVGLTGEGPSAAARLGTAGFAAVGYLAVAVTAVAFVLWYSCVRGLGAGRAGLLTGIAPAAAAVIGVPVTGAVPALPVWAGIALIATGLGTGLASGQDGPPAAAPGPRARPAGRGGPGTGAATRSAHPVHSRAEP